MNLHRWTRRVTAWRAATALLVAIGPAAGCGAKRVGSGPERVLLQVENRGYFDVIVYALRSPNTSGTRLGNVAGGSSVTLQVRYTDLQPGQRLSLRVRTLATNNSWLSPSLPVGAGMIPRLRVVTTATGSLNQSTLILESSDNGH